jgi:membrane-associated protease RseP (regulator of RpoE activity)
LILPGTFPVPPEAAQRPILTKEELAKALPELAAALREEKGQGATKPDVIVGTAGKELSDALQRLGFKGGDVITNINRAAVESAEQARKALDNVKNDLGFTVRIVRDGQSTWMRINAVEARPPAPPEPSVEPAKPKPLSPNESPKVSPAESPAAEPAGSEPSSPDESPAPSSEEPPAESPVTEKDKG